MNLVGKSVEKDTHCQFNKVNSNFGNKCSGSLVIFGQFVCNCKTYIGFNFDLKENVASTYYMYNEKSPVTVLFSIC